jgi:hypothetical protein
MVASCRHLHNTVSTGSLQHSHSPILERILLFLCILRPRSLLVAEAMVAEEDEEVEEVEVLLLSRFVLHESINLRSEMPCALW